MVLYSYFCFCLGNTAFIIFFHSSDRFTQTLWLPCMAHRAAMMIYNPLNHHLIKSKEISM